MRSSVAKSSRLTAERCACWERSQEFQRRGFWRRSRIRFRFIRKGRNVFIELHVQFFVVVEPLVGLFEQQFVDFVNEPGEFPKFVIGRFQRFGRFRWIERIWRLKRLERLERGNVQRLFRFQWLISVQRVVPI